MSAGLAGKRVVNTRAAHQAEALNALLRKQGALPLGYPCIAIVPPQDCAPLDAALRDLVAGRYDWLVMTSANTVRSLAQRLETTGVTLAGGPFRSAAVGPATAGEACESLGVEIVDLPEEFAADALARALPVEPGSRVLLPESAIARPALAHLLAERGAVVTVVTAYETVCASGGVDLARLAAQRRIDALTFTSSSTVTCFLERFQAEGGDRGNLRDFCVACIGAKTANTAREAGFACTVIPAESTLGGLVEALVGYFS